MKRIFVILAASMVLFGCVNKGGKSGDTSKTDTIVVVEEELVPVGNTEGAYFTDITALTPEGDELSLSELVGQTDYVLVDFWASWCGPCRRFVPVLKEIYAGLPEGKLQILSCSVDQEEGAWRKALEEELMPWPQMREDENHLCADRYDVQFIPHTVLIDSEGMIVGVNLDEAQIEQVLFAE